MIRAIAIDDEPLPLEIITNFCGQLPEIDLLGTFSKIQDAKVILLCEKIDLIFLDIQMPSISGLEFYKNYGDDRMVIFTTAFTHYAVEGFNLSAIDYLLKPYDFQRFQAAVKKAIDYHQFKQFSNQDSEYIFLKADYKIQKIAITDIQYIEGLADYLRIFLKGQKPLIVRQTMKSMTEMLPDTFCRVHRSFIVPLSAISAVKNRTIFIEKKEIPIGATYWEQFEHMFFK
ncbi:LytTR family DNA-binding domain-containing protein [Algoriphagus sp. D3-2-R+10]|uniref:LytR/AlgR family response regulator transcription factor n=1 Tax=Algoriphagus aurantiacus TaxID=3103948 RepID=UPI002B3BE267|nr:LytTR family DNA-binding domain-containing protein [Algoriphagus sp. D3-2-R+10]MEB2774218.1 LytTR family DNA-binding domain-containing protein [Algoriphagus sp. D3-2-R+10]